MKHTSLLSLLTLCTVLGACSDSGDSAPPTKIKPPASDPADVVDVAVNPRASWTTAKQRDSVKIETDKLTFPASGNNALLQKQAGDILVSDRGASGNNPDGFMRKVVSVQKQGDSIVVATEQAYLTEVINGRFDLNFANEELRFMSTEETGTTPQSIHFGPGLQPQFDSTVGLDLTYKREDVSIGELKALSFEVPLSNGWKASVSPSGSLKVKEAMYSLKPSINFGANIEVPGGFFGKFNPNNYLQELHLKLKGELGAKFLLSAEGALKVEFNKNLSKESGADNLASSIASRLKQASPFKSLTTPIVPGVSFVGPPLPTPFGPIPVTYTFEMDLVCGASLAGAVEMQVGWETSAMTEFGFVWEKDKGATAIKNVDFSFNKIGPNYSKVSGSLEAKCALEPKLLAKVAGFAGPFVKGSASAGVKLEVSESCEGIKDARPKPSLAFTGERGMGLGVGLEAGFKLGPVDVKIFEGQLTVYENKAKLFPDIKVDLPESLAIGYCSGESLVQAGNGGTGGTGGAGGSGNNGGTAGTGQAGTPGQGGTGQAGTPGQGGTAGAGSTGGAGGAGGSAGSAGGSAGSGTAGSSSSTCGDGAINNGEQCDGTNVGTMTCKTLLLGSSKATGSPTCTADCKYDVSSCGVGAVCGDVCAESENPQKVDCGDCQKTVCETPGHEYCCTEAWDFLCIEDAKTFCGQCGG